MVAHTIASKERRAAYCLACYSGWAYSVLVWRVGLGVLDE